jgi:WD40 repeat protein
MVGEKVIDYRDLIARLTNGFVGRQWVRDAVDEFLRGDTPRHFLLLGEPGCGKSTFLADLVKRRGYPHHFVGRGSRLDAGDSPDWRSPVRLAESLGYHLVRDYGGWVMSWEDWGISVRQEVKELQGLLVGAPVETFQGTPRPEGRPVLKVEQEVERFGWAAQAIGVYIENFRIDVAEVVSQLLLKPLRRVAQRWPDHQVVVVIDGLDEAEGYAGGIAGLLPTADLPLNVRFILSSRAGPHLTLALTAHAKRFWLSEDEHGERAPQALEDAREYVGQLTKEDSVRALLERKEVGPEALEDRVAQASGGNFLYLHHYAEGLRTGDERLLTTETLPNGLYDIYAYFLSRIEDKHERDVPWTTAYKPVLGTLAVAREPLPQSQLAEFAGVDREALGSILRQAKQFVEEVVETEERRYCLYHSSFGEFLTSKQNEDTIDGQKAHGRIAEHFLNLWSDLRDGVPRLRDSAMRQANSRYGLKHLPIHLSKAAEYDKLASLLMAFNFLEAKVECRMVVELASDFTTAERTIPPQDSRLRNLRLLGEALRRDITFIARHSKDYPQGLFQCLWNSCWWYDCPEAAEHYDPPRGGWDTDGPPWQGDGEKLYKWMHAWRQEKERAGAFVWVRSLRPPPVPLGGALLAICPGHSHRVRHWSFSSGKKSGGPDLPGDRSTKTWRMPVAFDVGVSSLSWSPDGCVLASGANDKTVRLWDRNGRELACLHGHEEGVRLLSWSPDSRVLASGSDDKTVRLWERNSGRQLACLQDRVVKALAWSPVGRVLACGGERLWLWYHDTGRESCLSGHEDVVNALCWSPDGCILASGGRSYDKTVRLWDRDSGRELACLTGHEDHVTALSWSPDGNVLASAARDNTVRLWNRKRSRKGGHELVCLAGHDLSEIALTWSPDGRVLASASGDNKVLVTVYNDRIIDGASARRVQNTVPTMRLWERDSGRELAFFLGHELEVTALAWSPDSKVLARGNSDGTVRLSARESGGQLACLRGHENRVQALAWSSDGKVLATGADDKTVRLWDPVNARELPTLRGHKDPVAEQGGIVWSSDGGWSPDPRLLHDRDLSEEIDWAVMGITWFGGRPWYDGRLLQSQDLSDTEIVWDTETGRPLYTGSQWENGFAVYFDDHHLWGDASHDDIFGRIEGESVFLQAKTHPPIAWFPVGIKLKTVDGRMWAGCSGSEVYLLRLEGMDPVAAGFVYEFATLRPATAARLHGKRALFRIKLYLDSRSTPEDEGIYYECEGENELDELTVGRTVILPTAPDEGVDVLIVEAVLVVLPHWRTWNYKNYPELRLTEAKPTPDALNPSRVPALPHEAQIRDSIPEPKSRPHGSGDIYLVRTKDLSDRAVWFYLSSEPEKIQELEKTRFEDQIDLTKFGRILASGWGQDPPESERDRMREEYGYEF